MSTQVSGRQGTRGRFTRPLLGVSAIVGLAFTLSGCSADAVAELKRLGLPEEASDRAPYVHDLWINTWIAAGVIGVLVWALIIFAVLRWRNRGNVLPRQTRYNLPMEIMYTTVPFVILGVLFYYTVIAQSNILQKVETPQHTVDVVGQKWSWTFNYLEKQNADVGDNVYEAGTIEQSPDLYLVVDQSVRFNLSSPDVIHSFYIPAFAFKLDVIPGRANSFDVTPTKEGRFVGRCAELCGTYHSAMVFYVNVVSEDEYNAHLQELKERGNVGIAKGGSYATTIERGSLAEAPGDEEPGTTTEGAASTEEGGK